VNSRRLAERLAGALNDLAGEALVRSHHGSLALAQRTEVEELLKSGALKALVATSSLELGIDMGAIDLVVQIEAPPSVSSGLQRLGRAGHQVDAVSEGVIFPKFRGDLVACATVAKAMREGAVEPVRYPRNPLDVLAQQVVAMVAMDDWDVSELFETVRRAAPFAELGLPVFENVLDMLAGRYPSDEFAALKPRLTWDRVRGRLSAREGARRIAVANGGTIPDRGLYGVFLSGRVGEPGGRVGELDEEMVFESRVGDVFVLGASSWRIEEITHDRVLVAPAAGEPGKMPFWKGDRAGRPLELGLAIGRLTAELLRSSPEAAVQRLIGDHDLDEPAARSLLAYLNEQATAGAVPDTETVVVERVRDEVGDWRVCVLSPRGGRVHAPWAMAVCAKIREARGFDVEMLWGDDGFVVRLPDTELPPDPRLLTPDPEEAHQLIVRQLGATALFAAKFRENAARSLLLPRRRPGMRAPLWQQRKRAADLLAVASRYGSFPVLLETYRECLRDFFDLPALTETLSELRSRKIRLVTIDSERPSPFAASLLFSYVASFLYDGDAPLAERRAQALVVDQAQLGELLGDAELRELLDPGAIDAVERQLQRLEPRYHARTPDGVHDLLLALGDLALGELRARTDTIDVLEVIADLTAAGRVLAVTIAGEERFIAVEDAARYRDAVGAVLPGGLPRSLLEPASEPVANLALRYARTHAPFTLHHFVERFGLERVTAAETLGRLTGEGRLLEGEFRPGGTDREWTDESVLRMLRRRSLAKLRKEVEPVDQSVLGRLLTHWHGVVSPRASAVALLDVVEQLQGAPMPASLLETDILPARLAGYDPAQLDAALAAGEIAWVGLEPIGDNDGRVALFLADRVQPLLPPVEIAGSIEPGEEGSHEVAIVEWLLRHGASFFASLHDASGGGYPPETVAALWRLAWSGLVTNDTFHALRAFTRTTGSRSRQGAPDTPRVRRLVPPSAEGRWSLVLPARAERYLKVTRTTTKPSRVEATRWAAAVASQLLTRHGVVNREATATENLPGGFSSVYPVLKAMEDAGRVRRGYFVAGLGATQFALPGALDRLRSMRDSPAGAEASAVMLAAADPANPYGAILKWPPPVHNEQGRAPSRSVGAHVLIVDGALVAYLARGDRVLSTWIPTSEPERSRAVRLIGATLLTYSRQGDPPRGMLLEQIDGIEAVAHPIASYLIEAGFLAGALGLQASLKSDF
jgi:ATP-dependent Lhr-like helicase